MLTATAGPSGFVSSGGSRFGCSSSPFLPNRSTVSLLLDQLVGFAEDPLAPRRLPHQVLVLVLPVVLLPLHVGESPLLVRRVSRLPDRRHRRGGGMRIERDDEEGEGREVGPGPPDPGSQPADAVRETEVADVLVGS